MAEPLRIQRKRTAGWRMPPNTVYVGRPGAYGNPFDFRSSEHSFTAIAFGCRADANGRRQASVVAYQEWIGTDPDRQVVSEEFQVVLDAGDKSVGIAPKVEVGAAPSIGSIRDELRGRNLACWCRLCPGHADGKPFTVDCDDCAPCHADPLGRIANAPSCDAPS